MHGFGGSFPEWKQKEMGWSYLYAGSQRSFVRRVAKPKFAGVSFRGDLIHGRENARRVLDSAHCGKARFSRTMHLVAVRALRSPSLSASTNLTDRPTDRPINWPIDQPLLHSLCLSFGPLTTNIINFLLHGWHLFPYNGLHLQARLHLYTTILCTKVGYGYSVCDCRRIPPSHPPPCVASVVLSRARYFSNLSVPVALSVTSLNCTTTSRYEN